MNIIFAGDRQIAVRVLNFVVERGFRPAALCLSAGDRASHAEELRTTCDWLPPERVFRGGSLRSHEAEQVFRRADPDLFISVHFPYLVPDSLLRLPRRGCVNLHPALLPYNRGWHTPSWAILDGTPYGATLHMMESEVDAGDIVYQEEIEILPEDTAHTLYTRVQDLEFDVFCKAWPLLLENPIPATPQDLEKGTVHDRTALVKSGLQVISLDREWDPNQLLDRLRALTTNRLSEAAFFTLNGCRYRVQLSVTRETPAPVLSGKAEAS
ncbi:methionyl-tRNA formyltransferase [Gemmatimonadota bacterium]